jgi:hypothetical protein
MAGYHATDEASHLKEPTMGRKEYDAWLAMAQRAAKAQRNTPRKPKPQRRCWFGRLIALITGK